MRRTISFIIAILGMSVAYGQRTVSADSLRYYEGEIITVCEKVATTFVTQGKEKTTILNFGNEFPHHFFTIIIFQEDLPNFSYKPAEFLKGKNICVIGDVRMYNSGPEIIVEREEQIEVSKDQ